jgi:hypothetical protein
LESFFYGEDGNSTLLQNKDKLYHATLLLVLEDSITGCNWDNTRMYNFLILAALWY